jgi:NADPH:quinone reductase-like Zn-dependent oxidoreductase
MSQYQIPEQMTAVVLESYSGVESLRVEQRAVPSLRKNEVLVKVAASPINPSDLAFLQGEYGIQKPLPVVPGIEGSGTVVAVGSGIMGRYLKGKQVACVSQIQGDGVWADYLVTTANYALPLDKSVSLEQGAMSVVNPLTAIALLSIAKKGGHKTMINTAAASALGQMINRLSRVEGIQVINIVRRDAQVAFLKQQGAAIVLNSNDSSFSQQLYDLCHQHEARLAFDAVAGSMTLQLLEAMPENSKVTIYGGLSWEAAQVAPNHVIFQNKRVDGFWLPLWLAEKSLMQNLMTWRRAQKLLSTDLKSDIRVRYPLKDARNAVLDYQNNMTGGKVLLIPGRKD